ncbi:SACA9 protein, partial [Melanocharis versteri]|nr:SACA9 protein [Melanocharis versteri]
MNEVVETLRKIEQNYKLFQQQQFTFVRALEHTREEAHDLIRPVSSIVQVQIIQHKVLPAHHNRDSTGLACTWGQFRGEEMLLLREQGPNLSSNVWLHCWDSSANCFPLSHSFPHGVVNYLSLDEARNRYGGVVSLIPIVIDNMKEWITYTKRHLLPNVSRGCAMSKKETSTSQTPPAGHLAARTSISKKNTVQLQDRECQRCKYEDPRLKNKAPWRPPG